MLMSFLIELPSHRGEVPHKVSRLHWISVSDSYMWRCSSSKLQGIRIKAQKFRKRVAGFFFGWEEIKTSWKMRAIFCISIFRKTVWKIRFFLMFDRGGSNKANFGVSSPSYQAWIYILHYMLDSQEKRGLKFYTNDWLLFWGISI